jgi:selenocysteine lyase/cysteine desulfurase
MSEAPALTAAEKLAFEAARARFPGALSQSYIDVASRGLMPGDIPQIAFDHLQQRVFGRADKKAYFETVERARNGVAKLLNAKPHEIATARNITDGLNMVANALDWKPGDEVFFCSGVEHPANLYVWRNLEKLGVKVRDFPAQDGQFPVEAVEQALRSTHGARILAVSATSFVPGFRADLERIGNACRAAGVHLVVDGAQSVGITHLDMERLPVDALAMSTQKGLCSLYGMGFLYVREAFAERLSPRFLSRFGVDMSGTHEADYDPGPITLQRGALRFELGNHNFLAATLVSHSLDLINGLGTQAIDRHVTSLASRLADGLIAAGAPVRTPRSGGRANIVSIESLRGAEPVAQLQKHLKECNVAAALRRNVVRFSFHLYNAESDVDAALSACREWLDRSGQTLR